MKPQLPPRPSLTALTALALDDEQKAPGLPSRPPPPPPPQRNPNPNPRVTNPNPNPNEDKPQRPPPPSHRPQIQRQNQRPNQSENILFSGPQIGRKSGESAFQFDADWNTLQNKVQPLSQISSLDHLKAAIINLASTEMHALQLVYTWICGNIAYDVVTFFSGAFLAGGVSAEQVFSTRKAVCSGYAVLFADLSLSVGLRGCRVINGHGRGFGNDITKSLGRLPFSTHAWNSVLINGEWYLVDSCWGAGTINSNNKFEWKFNPYFFLTRPSEFVYSHFPCENPSDQLLPSPLSWDEYDNLNDIKPLLWTSGTLLISRETRFEKETGDLISIALKGQRGWEFLARAYYVSSPTNETLDGFVLMETESDGSSLVKVLFKIATPNTYILKIMARKKGESLYYDMIAFPAIIHSASSNSTIPVFPFFPRVFSVPFFVQSPLENPLQRLGSYTFSLQSADHGDTSEIALVDEQMMLTRCEKFPLGKWSKTVRLQARGKYRFCLVQGNQFTYLCEWDVL